MFDRVRCSRSAARRSSSLVEGDMRRLMASVLRSAVLVMSVQCLYDALNVTINALPEYHWALNFKQAGTAEGGVNSESQHVAKTAL